jgi:hypothetical protein
VPDAFADAWHFYGFFNPLVNNIERLINENRAPYPGTPALLPQA